MFQPVDTTDSTTEVVSSLCVILVFVSGHKNPRDPRVLLCHVLCLLFPQRQSEPSPYYWGSRLNIEEQNGDVLFEGSGGGRKVIQLT